MDASVDVAHLECERSVRIFSRADRLLPVWKFIAREVASYRPTHAVLREVEVCVVSDDGKGVGYGCSVILVSVSYAVVKRLEAQRQLHSLSVLHLHSHLAVVVPHYLVLAPWLLPLLVLGSAAHLCYGKSLTQISLFRLQTECGFVDDCLAIG